ncbi:MAG: hypothetical protein D6806_06260 [Deltaproteobacteria bacterium]|nr:MAG: hypothetical protein D6806_06260 [Deltaproteobacteria bacterium]
MIVTIHKQPASLCANHRAGGMIIAGTPIAS